MTVKSNCELDTRIKSIDDIQTIICNNHGFIGCKGFFFDQFVQTKNLTKCHYGTLVDIDINGYNDDHCFKARDENGNDFIGYYRFFIPEKLLKPIKKKYRPFSIEEWKFKHSFGDTILYRRKGTYCGWHREAETMYLGYVKQLNGITDEAGKGELILGDGCYDIQNLFDNYEIWIDGGWQPFGVKVKDGE